MGAAFDVNADAAGYEPIILTELYWAQSVFGDKLRVHLGRVKLTGGFHCKGCPSTFDGNSFANDQTTQFLNAAFVNNPTIGFPEPGLAAVLYSEIREWWYVAASAANAEASVTRTGFDTGLDEYFLIAETGFLPLIPSSGGDLQGGYRFGAWYDTRQVSRISGNGSERGNKGFYFSMDQVLWREGKDKDQGLGIFGRYGITDEDLNEVSSFWSTGIHYKGLIPTRGSDVLGIAFAQGHINEAGSDLSSGHEKVLELYYNIKATSWLGITPDFQYVWNPGGDGKDALVIGLRLQFTI